MSDLEVLTGEFVGSFSGQTFPRAVGIGSSVGIGHKTHVTSQIRGEEHRWVRAGQASRRYRVSRRADKAQLEEVRRFVTRHGGSRDGFYFVDPLDNSTAADHRGDPSLADQWLGVGDGVTTAFSLMKRYEKGTQYERARRCYGIENIVIAVNDHAAFGGPVTLIQGQHYVVDVNEGIVYFLVTPPEGSEVTGGWRFKVRARFDISTDKELGEVYAGFEAGEILVSIVEDKFPTRFPERMRYGVGAAVLSPKLHEVLQPDQGQFVFYLPAAAMTLYLPDIRGEEEQVVPSYGRTMVRGGPYHTVYNASVTPGATITLKEVYTDTTPKAAYRFLTTEAVIQPGQARSLYVGDASSSDPNGVTGQVWVSA